MTNPLKAVDDTSSADPFNLELLRVSQDFMNTVGVKKQLTTVPVRKPNKQDFFRVHSNQDYRENLSIIELKDDREIYLVTNNVLSDLTNEAIPVTIFTTVNRQGVLSLWPVRIPPSDGKSNEYWISARSAAETAMTKWVRMQANMSLGAYDIMVSEAIKLEPEWPDLSFTDILRIAFRDRLVSSITHPVVNRLRGLV